MTVGTRRLIRCIDGCLYTGNSDVVTGEMNRIPGNAASGIQHLVISL